MAKGYVKFEDNTMKVIDKTENIVESTLLECAAEIVSQTAKNTRVKTGKTKNAWAAEVDETKEGWEATIGNPEENAIWEEFGTGEYALKGNGRKGGWFYEDEEGNGHFTHGKTPSRAFWNAYNSLKKVIQNRIEEMLKGLNS